MMVLETTLQLVKMLRTSSIMRFYFGRTMLYALEIENIQ